MSSAICGACAKPMNDVATSCPHCGKRRAQAAVGLAGHAVTPDEVAALLNFDGGGVAPSQGVLATLILPHPNTYGTGRMVELVCTVIALPLVVVGAFLLALKNRKHRAAAEATTGELTPVLAMLGLGGLTFYGCLSLAGLSLTASLLALAVSICALIVRGTVRARVAMARSRKLLRLAKTEPAAVNANATPALVAASRATPVTTKAPAKVEPRGPGEEPSLLL